MSAPWRAIDKEPLSFLLAPTVCSSACFQPDAYCRAAHACTYQTAACTCAQAASTFLENTWEKGPAVFKATPERQAVFEGLFGYGEFEELIKARAEEGARAAQPPVPELDA